MQESIGSSCVSVNSVSSLAMLACMSLSSAEVVAGLGCCNMFPLLSICQHLLCSQQLSSNVMFSFYSSILKLHHPELCGQEGREAESSVCLDHGSLFMWASICPNPAALTVTSVCCEILRWMKAVFSWEICVFQNVLPRKWRINYLDSIYFKQINKLTCIK